MGGQPGEDTLQISLHSRQVPAKRQLCVEGSLVVEPAKDLCKGSLPGTIEGQAALNADLARARQNLVLDKDGRTGRRLPAFTHLLDCRDRTRIVANDQLRPKQAVKINGPARLAACRDDLARNLGNLAVMLSPGPPCRGDRERLRLHRCWTDKQKG
ncbi:MAG: hypothetical protein ACK442_14155 [Novosphingobium sp.]